MQALATRQPPTHSDSCTIISLQAQSNGNPLSVLAPCPLPTTIDRSHINSRLIPSENTSQVVVFSAAATRTGSSEDILPLTASGDGSVAVLVETEINMEMMGLKR